MQHHRPWRIGALAVLSVTALASSPALIASATTVTTTDTEVTVDAPYVKANGVLPTDKDAITYCGQNRRQQNEPSVAVDPAEPSIIVAGSNDYCTVEGMGGTWTGFYRSTDSGTTWVDSLLPGYPTDESPEGKASPLQQRGITNAGDPVQAWDNDGRLFYMGNAFNRSMPQNGSVWVATYDENAAHYVRTVIVGTGVPAFYGRFNDKTSIEVDRSAKSPYSGHVYAAWSLFQGAGNNSIQFVRSTDHGKTFSHPMKISTGSKDVQFADIAVTSNGTVYVAYRQFDSRGHLPNAIMYVVSKDGGKTFSRPSVAATFEPFDAADTAGNPTAAAAAHEQAWLKADGPGAEAGSESVGNSRDCGSGPFACQSGFVFFRHDSQPRITADPNPTKAGDERVYLVYDATVPGSEKPSETTYNTADPAPDGTLQVGQGAIYFSTLDQGKWSDPTQLAPIDKGHQFFPDINADGGVLHAIWHDSRNDKAYSVQYPPGNDGADRDTAGFAAATAGLDTYGASSTDGGTTWSVARLSAHSQQPNYEMFGDRRVPFQGDYNYVSSVGSFAYNVWTDNRQVVGGDDPRYGGGVGFDVWQCRTQQDGTWSADTCPNAGGLDQDIFGAATTG